MKQLVKLLAASVRRSPWAVLIAALVATAVLGAFITQQETATGSEGFSPDSPEFLAQDVISEHFSDNSETSAQIVMTAKDGDLITATGLRDYVAVRRAIETSEVADLLKGRPGGDIVGYFDPLLQGLQLRAEETGIPLEMMLVAISDLEVKEGFRESFSQIPVEMSGLFRGLLDQGFDLETAEAEAGLMVVYLNLADLDDPDGTILQGKEVDMADAVAALDAQAAEGSAFSYSLLFADTDQFASEIGRLFATAFIIIVLILLFVFWIHPKGNMTWGGALRRALGDVTLTMLVIVMSIVWMNGIGVLLGPRYLGLIGDFNEMLQLLPILLIGLGVDYAIHMTSRYREELGEGIEVPRAAARATRTVGIALVLATVTTSIGFLTNVINPIAAIADFGVLAAVGISSAFLLMLTVVPSIRVLLDRRAESRGRLTREALGRQSERLLPKLMGSTSVLAERFSSIVIILALVAAGAGVYGFTQLNTEFSFTDFLPEDSSARVAYDSIVSDFAGGFGEETEIIIEGDVATPAVHNALVAAWGNLGDNPNVVQYGERATAESPVSVIGGLVSPPDQGGDTETYDAEFAQFALAAGLQPDLTVAESTDVAALYRAALEAARDPMRRVVAEVDGAFRFVDMGVSTQAGEAEALLLRDDLRADFAPVREAGATAVATNQSIISQGVAKALQDSQLWSLGLTILVAGMVLAINFWFESRRPFLGVITILPVVLIVLLVFGMMAARGIAFNPVTAMIANLAIGIGVPYTIHITHRYQEDRLRHGAPEAAIRSTTTHTGGALAGSAFTTAAGFGVLVTSSLKPFQQFGEVTFWAIIFALVGSVLVLPSLLIVWDRWHLNRGETVVDEARIQAVLEGQET